LFTLKYLLRLICIKKTLKYAANLPLALKASCRKIVVFLVTVFTLVVIFGSLMYLIEGGQNGFTSIPRSIYWAIVTMTTVGAMGIFPPKPHSARPLPP